MALADRHKMSNQQVFAFTAGLLKIGGVCANDVNISKNTVKRKRDKCR